MAVLSLIMAMLAGSGSSMALPRASRASRSVGDKWAMKDFTRNCVEGEPPNICDYSLNVYEADFRTLVTSCNLHIEYEAGQSALDFGKANCTPGYWANGGYNKPGPENPDFQVISIVKENEPKNLVAYFGVDDNKINSGHGVDPVISDVGYVPGEFAGEAKEEKRNTIDVEKATSWKVLNMNRDVLQEGRLVDTLHVEFDLVDGDDESIKQHIQFLKDVPEGTNAYKMEFFDVECTNTNECNGWRLWWGNMENTDGAVLTVKNPSGTKVAWFGWDKTSERGDLPAVGPNAIENQ